MAGPIGGDAWISACGRYRYWLYRAWGSAAHPTAARSGLWIMLNPSTADAAHDDATIRRCRAFSQRWGWDAMTVVNLFARRATDPKQLKLARDPVGPANDQVLLAQAGRHDFILAAWGNHGGHRRRDAAVLAMLGEQGLAVMCLGVTRQGRPRHPLYVAAHTTPSPFTGQVVH
jgi:hypothetical protein